MLTGSRLVRRLAAALMLVLLGLLASPAGGAPKVREHRVARGNTLGKLAKRYTITVEALCYANDIEKNARIKIGQKLLIPPKDDEGGKKTRKVLDKRRSDQGDDEGSKKKRSKPKRDDKKKRSGKKKVAAPGEPSWHRVYRRQNLGSIARRYHTTVAAIVHANDIQKKEPIHPGQMLIIPPKDDEDGSRTRRIYDARDGEPPVEEADEPKKGTKAGSSWAKYKKTPKKKGYIRIVGRKDRGFEGYLVNHKRLVTTKAKKAMKQVLATADGDEHDIDLRLLRLLADVSDTFGGRAIRIVSGFRLGSTSATSRHRHGKAIDFVVVGVPNTALRDYIKTLDDVGVGYYPNSSFIHMDVRTQWTYWIDYSGPGQRPRYGGFWTRRSK